jgi:twinkle protein
MRLPCPHPDCDSSDGYHVDQEGNGYCFSCEHYTLEDNPTKDTSTPLTTTQIELEVGGSHMPVPSRKISKDTCAFFDVKTKNNSVVFPYFDKEGSLVGQKTRPLSEKRFIWRGDAKKSTLFGQNKFTGGQTITIVEGEFDALAFRDLCGDYPVVSIINGAQGAVKDIRKNLEYFKNFRKVVICFDNDEHGKKAAEKVAELFPIGKVKIASLRHYKDAGEYLENGKSKEFKDCWFQAIEYTPAGIEPANKGGYESLFDDIDDLELFPYPFDKLNEYTFGIRKGEMVTVVSGSGVGKSQFIGETAYELLMNTNKKLGLLMLEESTIKTKKRLLSLYLNRPLHLTLLGRLKGKFDFVDKVLDRLFVNKQDYEWDDSTKKEIKEAWNKVIERKAEDNEQQLWLFNHFGSNDIDTIVNRIDAMVTGLGCEFIFLDHISIVVSEQQNADERKALDELATKLRTLVERRNFSLVIVSHLRRPGGKPHEEGGETSLADIRGTAGIGQLSDIVIGLERNGQHPDPFLANITKMRVLKNRFSGMTGLTSYGHYDINTGRLLEQDATEVEAMFNNEEKGEESTSFVDETESVFDNTEFGTQEIERKAANGK